MASTKTTRTRTTKDATHLWLTDEEAHCRLLAERPEAFVIGFILDQQVTVQKAFRAPADLLERIGTIDPADLAAYDLAELEAAFRDKPALHRYPAAMAKRVQQAMRVIVERYDGDAGRIWWEAADLDDFRTRLEEIPGLRGHKWLSMAAVLNLRGDVPITGWEQDVQEWGTLGDVDSRDALKAYQTRKRAAKKAAREATKDVKPATKPRPSKRVAAKPKPATPATAARTKPAAPVTRAPNEPKVKKSVAAKRSAAKKAAPAKASPGKDVGKRRKPASGD